MYNRIRWVVVLSLVIASIGSVAWAKEINVPADFKTIGEALAGASAGDVIKVAEGTYTENLTISVSVTLEGAGADQTIIDGTPGQGQQQPTLFIRGVNNVTIRGFTIQNGRRGISTERATGIIIENNIIKNNLRQGVLLNIKSEGKILNNQIIENVPDADGALGRGVNLVDSQAVISGNNISKNAQIGVAVFFSKVEITNNQINENGLWGILLSHNPDTFDPAEGKVTGNTINGNIGIGLLIVGNTEFEISKNQVTNTQPATRANSGEGEGIWLEEGASAKLSENTISGNASHGVVVGSSSKGELVGNTITDNQGCGVAGASDATVSGSDNTISGNAGGDLCGNVPQSIKKG